jgi:hypothetical protein
MSQEEEMAGLWPGIREVEHPAVGAEHCAENERTHKSLDTTGLLMEGTESNRRRQPFQGCLLTPLSGSESAYVSVEQDVNGCGF